MDKFIVNNRGSIESRLKNIEEYFLGMEIKPYTDDDEKKSMIVSVGITIPAKWDVFEKYNADKYQVGTQRSPKTFMVNGKEMAGVDLWIDIECGFDSMFNAIDDLINKNKENEEKERIYQEKVNELKLMYEKSVNDLNRMFFNEEKNIDELKNIKCSISKEETKEEKEKTFLEPKENISKNNKEDKKEAKK